MLEKDGSEDFVEDIVGDLLGTTLNNCLDLFIQRQLIPFTVSEATDALLSIIEVILSFKFSNNNKFLQKLYICILLNLLLQFFCWFCVKNILWLKVHL